MAGTAPTKGRGGMSDQRHHRLRLDVSREASRLFWAQGVDATSGDQIAAGRVHTLRPEQTGRLP